MDFFRFKGLPIPEVYTYSYTPENEAGMEYVLIEYVEGTDISEVSFNLEKKEIDSLMDQLAELKSIMMSGASTMPQTCRSCLRARAYRSRRRTRTFHSTNRSGAFRSRRKTRASNSTSRPNLSRLRRSVDAWALMYQYHSGMEKEAIVHIARTLYVALLPSILPPLNKLLSIDEDAPSVLVTGSNKEIAYLDQFGSPRAPSKAFRRDCYNNKKQELSGHANNPRCYLLLALSLVPDNDSLAAFCIRHPDLNLENLKVLTDTSGLRIRSMLD